MSKHLKGAPVLKNHLLTDLNTMEAKIAILLQDYVWNQDMGSISRGEKLKYII